jgi:hypothetical protein
MEKIADEILRTLAWIDLKSLRILSDPGLRVAHRILQLRSILLCISRRGRWGEWARRTETPRAVTQSKWPSRPLALSNLSLCSVICRICGLVS